MEKLSEKQKGTFLQAKVKSINSLLDNNGEQREICRSKLASCSYNHYNATMPGINRQGKGVQIYKS